MRTLPAAMIRALAPFAPLFSKNVWQYVQVLVAGVILPLGRRIVSSALRVMGMDRQKPAAQLGIEGGTDVLPR